LDRGGVVETDAATLIEQMGRPVRIVPGDTLNFKITTPDDLALAKVVLQASQPGMVGMTKN